MTADEEIPSTGNAGARAARNGLWNIARVAVALPVFLFFTRFLYETLGDNTRGAWALIAAFWLQPALFDLGFGEAMTRAVARRRASPSRPLGRTMASGATLYLALAAALAGVYLLARPALSALIAGQEAIASDMLHACDLGLGAFLLSLLAWGACKVLHGFERYDLTSMIHVAGTLAYAGSGVMLLSTAPVLSSLGEAALASSALTLLLSLAFAGWQARCSRSSEPAPGEPAPEDRPLREILSFGPVLYLSSLAGIAEGVASKLILGAAGAGGAAATGYLDNALEVGGRLRTIPLLLAAPLFPAAAGAPPDETRNLFRSASRLNVLLATPLLVGGFAFATPFVQLWLGGDLPARVDETALALEVLCLGMFMQLLYVPAFHIWNGRGRPWPGTFASLVSAALSISLALALVDGHGLRASVAAIASGHTVACLGFLWWFHRAEEISLLETVVSEIYPPLAAMIASAGVWVLVLRAVGIDWVSFLACTSAAVALYGLFLLGIGHVTADELERCARAIFGRSEERTSSTASAEDA